MHPAVHKQNTQGDIAPLRFLIVAFCGFAILGGLGLTALVSLYSTQFGKCVKVPNGSELSYEAFVDFGNSYFKPDAVLRDPEGSILAKDVWPLHITEVATFGTALQEFKTSLPKLGGNGDYLIKWYKSFLKE